MILVIQTVKPEVEIMLFDDEVNLVFGEKWISQKDEIIKLLPELEKILKETGQEWRGIKKILVINGIGGFSSTRIGLTIANTLTLALNVQLYELTLPEIEVKLDQLVKDFFEHNPKTVKLSQPKYKSIAMISPSKKKKFN